MSRISTGHPSGSCQWVASACQSSLGASAQNRFHEEWGRFCGCGATKPRRHRIRQIVDAGDFGDVWVSGEMGGDGGCAGVVAGLVQRLAQPHDAFFQVGADRLGVVMRAARARLKRRRALGQIALAQSLYPGAGDVVSRATSLLLVLLTPRR